MKKENLYKVADLEKRVIIKIKEEGIQCEKNEDVLEYTM